MMGRDVDHHRNPEIPEELWKNPTLDDVEGQ